MNYKINCNIFVSTIHGKSLLPPLVSVVIVLLLPILIMPSAIILNVVVTIKHLYLRLSVSYLSSTYRTHVHKFGPQVHLLYRAQSVVLGSLRLTMVYLSAGPSVRYRSIGVWLGIYAGAIP